MDGLNYIILCKLLVELEKNNDVAETMSLYFVHKEKDRPYFLQALAEVTSVRFQNAFLLEVVISETL